MKNALSLTALIALTLVALVAIMTSAPASATQGVSPGETNRLSITNDVCPTFSWQGDDEAMLYEIVGYSLHTDEDPSAAKLAAEDEVFYTRVPAGATSWTPSAQQCVSAGGRYVWFVRPVIEAVDDQVIDAGEWSAGRYFQVPAGPSEAELAKAIDVLKRWEATNGGGEALPSSAGTRSGGASTTLRRSSSGSTRSDADSASPKSVPNATAAIRGYQSSSSGETYGVVGVSASPDGAGIGAANLVGGPDLVLDGTAQGQADAMMTQEGIFKTSASDELFKIQNSGAGDLDVAVFGRLTAEAVEADELRTSAWGAVVSEEGHWQGQGDTIPCDGCIDGDDVADGEIASTNLSAQGSVSGQVLKATGASVVWSDDSLELPFDEEHTSTHPLFRLKNWGNGDGIEVESVDGRAIFAESSSGIAAIQAQSNYLVGPVSAISGTSVSDAGFGVIGAGNTGVKGFGQVGVYGTTAPGGTIGVFGEVDRGAGVHGEADFGAGVVGISDSGDTGGYPGTGIYGEAVGSAAFGVYGVVESETPSSGVYGENGNTWGALGRQYEAVYGFGSGTDEGGNFESEDGHGIVAESEDAHGVYTESAGTGLNGAALYAKNTDPAGIAIRANADSTDAALVVGNLGGGDIAKFFFGSDTRFRVTWDGEVYADASFHSGGADFAELLPAYSDDLEPGDVLAIAADGRLMRSQHAYQASVVGVYSTKPGILGGSGIDGDTQGKIPLAVVGVVPVKTCDENGPVRPGDMLVSSSIPGHAMRAGDRAPNGRVIGKALSGLEAGRGEITMLVILQ